MPRILIVLILILFANTARAERVLDHYDLDSLWYLSDAVVRVEVGDSKPFHTEAGDCHVHTVQVLDVFKGSVKAGASVRVTGLDEFNRAPGIVGRADCWDPIQKGDVVYLFLVANGKTGYSMYGLVDADWTVIESGARLLDSGRVYSFGQLFSFDYRGVVVNGQHAPHGGFVAMTDATFPGAPVLTRDEFENRLKKSSETVARINQLVDASPKQKEQIIQTLRARSQVLKSEMADVDRLGGKLCGALEGIAAPSDLDTLRSEVPRGTSQTLESMLQWHAEGRSYLLDRMADPKEPMERRKQFADILSEAGFPYAQDAADVSRGGLKELDADFETRLARVAVANLGTNLSEPLLRGIADATHGNAIGERLKSDLQGAAKVLADAFPTATAVDQFRIAETLMQIDDQTYHRVLPNGGPMLTLVEPARDFKEALSAHALHLEVRFRNRLVAVSRLTLVLHPQDGGRDSEFSVDSEMGKWTDNFGGGSIKVAIPDVVTGKFHVFLRDYQNHDRRGDGLGFDVQLPGN